MVTAKFLFKAKANENKSEPFSQPISGQCSHFIPPENTRKKTFGFLVFSEGMKWGHWFSGVFKGIKWEHRLSGAFRGEHWPKVRTIAKNWLI